MHNQVNRGTHVPHFRGFGTFRAKRHWLGLAVVVFVLAAACSQPGGRPQDVVGVRPQDVVDAETGQAYLTQNIPVYYRQGQSEATGVFEFFRAPIEEVRAFQVSVGIYDMAWEESAATDAIVLAWSSPGASLFAPRPRPGIEAQIAGDAFLIFLEPGTGLEMRAVVASEALGQLRRSGVDNAQAKLVLPAGPTPDPHN